MTPEDEKWLATQIVRCAERWADRIGVGGLTGLSCAPRCIIGEIGDATFIDGDIHWGNRALEVMYYSEICGPGLMGAVVALNDQGIPWGKIPELLGLVPGEYEEFQGGNDEKAVAVGDGAAAAPEFVFGNPPAQLDDAGAGQRGDMQCPRTDAVAAECIRANAVLVSTE